VSNPFLAHLPRQAERTMSGSNAASNAIHGKPANIKVWTSLINEGRIISAVGYTASGVGGKLMSSSEPITADMLKDALQSLDALAVQEYAERLDQILTDDSRSLEARLWRIGRLAAIEVKRPFASPIPIEESVQRETLTGARRAWVLRKNEPAVPRPDLWQYRLLESLSKTHRPPGVLTY
jgi:hypothetical protein